MNYVYLNLMFCFSGYVFGTSKQASNSAASTEHGFARHPQVLFPILRSLFALMLAIHLLLAIKLMKHAVKSVISRMKNHVFHIGCSW